MPAPPRFIGRYAVIDRLGHGGMGVVYRAWDPDLRRQVAIKVIAVSDDDAAGVRGEAVAPAHADLFERCLREAQAAAALTHPHIVTIFDVGRHAGRPYIVMELVDGDTLAQVIQRSERHALADRVRWAIELCEGLAFAHAHGVIHRDVKPANVMLTSTGALKVLDFGIARIMDELPGGRLTRSGGVLGTPQYMSPEQIAGEPGDARSDVFSVGAVLYELFSGRPPFVAPTPAMVPVLVLQQSPPPMTGLPPSLEQLVARALEKDPLRRFQRLDDLALGLRTWLRDAGEGEPTGRPDLVDRTVPVAGDHLDGLLAQWEQAIGQALDEPGTPASPPQRQPLPAPARRATHANVRVLAALLVASLLGVAGAYWQVNRRTTPEPTGGNAPAVPASETLPAAASTPPSETVAPVTSPSPAGTAVAGAPRPTPLQRPPAPAPARTLTPEVKARCTDIVQRVGLGEELTVGDREFLSRQCRDRSP